MSEFLAEASVLVSPDLTAFRAKLLAELTAATRVVAPPIVIPVTTSGTGVAAAATGLQALASKQQSANVAEAAAIGLVDRHAKSMSNLTRGVGIQALSFAGLRGAVLNANPAFIAGAAAALVFGAAIKTAASLESELAVFRVTAGATADEMERVAANATALGADLTLPAVSAGDAAEAMTELAKAGLSVNDAIGGARGVLQLATAAQITNAEATELAANALNAYGLAGDKAVHVADVLANAANSAQGSIVDFGQALAQSSAVARQVGLSLEDTTAILTLFARNGLRGSDAGTALRTSLIRLIAPTNKANGVIDDLGLKIRDLNGNVRADIFAQFGKATADLSPALRDAAAAIIFGQDAIRAVAIGAREGTAGLRSAQADIAQTGTAAELAAARMEGLVGAARGLGSNLDTLGVTLGNVALPALTGFTNAVSSLVSGLNTGLQAVGDFNAGLTGLVEQADEASPVLQKIGDIFGFLNRIEFNLDPRTSGLSLRDNDVKTLQDAADAFKEIGLSADEQRAKLGDLFGPLIANAQAVRKTLADQGLFTGGIDKQIADLRSQLDALRLGVPFEEAKEAMTPLELSLISVRKQIELFKGLGLDTTAFERSADVIEARLDALTRTRPARESGGIAPGIQADLARVKSLLLQAQTDAKHLDPTDPLAPAARKSIQAVIAELRKLGPAGAAALKDAGALLQASFKVNVTDGLIASAELGVAQAAAAGSRAQVSSLRVLEGAQQKALKDAQFLFRAAGGKAAAEGGKKLAVERAGKLTEAFQALDTTRGQIKGIQDQVVADAKADEQAAKTARNEAQAARDKADQNFLDSLQPRRARIDRGISRAGGTPGLQDDINQQRALKQRLNREKELIKDGVKDARDAAQAIAARVAELITVGQTLTKLRKQKADAQKEIAEDRSAERTALLEGRVQLAELRGDKGAEVRAIDVLIADVNKRIASTKKATSAYVQLLIERQELINKRKEVLDQDEEGKKQTSAFDLLKQSAETFTANAGSLINANQPFAGPTGFTADLAQFLKRQQTVAGVTAPSAPGKGQIPLKDEGLIAALDRLRITIETTSGGRRNTSTATGRPAGESGHDNRWKEARTARAVVDSEEGGHGGV